MSNPRLNTSSCHTCNKTSADINGQAMKICSRCRTTTYCSIDCQRQDWKLHKPICRDPSLPTILVIAAGDSANLLESTSSGPLTGSSHLLAGLRRYAHVVISKTAVDAMKSLVETGNLRAVVLADGATLSSKKFKDLRKKVVAYAKEGGTLVLGATFACFTRPDAFDGFMRDSIGLPWTFGDYHRAVVYLNKANVVDGRFKGDVKLAESYSQKAVSLKGVDVGDRVYVPDERSTTQSMVFASTGVDQSQSPVCWKKLGEGWLGYVGDVNCEDESTAVMLAMCNLG